MVNWFLTRVPRKFSGKIIFSTNGAEIFEYPYAKEWIWIPSLDHIQKLTQNQRLKVRANTIRDFPGGPAVKTSPSSTGGMGSIPGRGA